MTGDSSCFVPLHCPGARRPSRRRQGQCGIPLALNEKAPATLQGEVRHERRRLRRRGDTATGRRSAPTASTTSSRTASTTSAVLPRVPTASWRSSASTATRPFRPLEQDAASTDDPVKQSNKRGYVTFATDRRRTRGRRRCSSTSGTTRRSTSRASRRSARSSKGMDVVDKINSRVRREAAGPGQDSDRGQRVPEQGVPEARLHQEGDHRALGADAESGYLVIWLSGH